MADQFIYCPQCGSDKIISSDFDDDEEGEESIECDDCGWQGTAQELVCQDDEDDK